MKIEIQENFKHDGADYTAEDQLTVDDELGAYFCAAGWAKDLSGKVETAPRDTSRTVRLNVNSARHSNSASEVK